MFTVIVLLDFKILDKTGEFCVPLPVRLIKMASETLYEIVLAKIRLGGFLSVTVRKSNM